MRPSPKVWFTLCIALTVIATGCGTGQSQKKTSVSAPLAAPARVGFVAQGASATDLRAAFPSRLGAQEKKELLHLRNLGSGWSYRDADESVEAVIKGGKLETFSYLRKADDVYLTELLAGATTRNGTDFKKRTIGKQEVRMWRRGNEVLLIAGIVNPTGGEFLVGIMLGSAKDLEGTGMLPPSAVQKSTNNQPERR